MVTVKVSYVFAENVPKQKKFKTSSQTHVETEAGLAKDLRETCDNLWKKTKECDSPRAKIGELEKNSATLRNAPYTNKKKI